MSAAFKKLFVALIVFAVPALAQDSLNIRTVGHSHDTCNTLAYTNIGGIDYLVIGSAYHARISILNVSDPAAITKVSAISAHGQLDDLTVVSHLVYAAAATAGLRIIDISTPTNPVELGYWDSTTVHDVTISGNYAYLVDYYSLKVINISVPTSPYQVGSFDTPDGATGVALADSLAYVAAGSAGLRVILISDSSDIHEVGFYDTPGTAWKVTLSGAYAYIADWTSGLRVIDVSDPANPAEVGSCTNPGTARVVAVEGHFAYVADYGWGLRVIDISNPAIPTQVGYYRTYPPGDGYCVAVHDGRIYIAGGQGELRICEGYGPAGVATGQVQNGTTMVNGLRIKTSGNKVDYQLPNAGRAQLAVYNVAGQRVRTLVDANKPKGSFETNWDGRNTNGRRAASGVYLVRLESGGRTAAAKMVVVR